MNNTNRHLLRITHFNGDNWFLVGRNNFQSKQPKFLFISLSLWIFRFFRAPGYPFSGGATQSSQVTTSSVNALGAPTSVSSASSSSSSSAGTLSERFGFIPNAGFGYSAGVPAAFGFQFGANRLDRSPAATEHANRQYPNQGFNNYNPYPVNPLNPLGSIIGASIGGAVGGALTGGRPPYPAYPGYYPQQPAYPGTITLAHGLALAPSLLRSHISECLSL